MKPALFVTTIIFGIFSVSSASTFSALNIDFLGRAGAPQGLVAKPGDVANVFWNHSGLAFSRAAVGFAGYMDYLVDVRGGTAGYMGVAGEVGYGLSISYLTSGSITRTTWDDPTGGIGLSFTHSEVVAGLSGGVRVLPSVSLGAGLKFARQSLDDALCTGVFADLSGTVKVYPTGSAGVGGHLTYASFTTRNIVLTSTPDDEGKPPLNSELGVVLELPEKGFSLGLSFCFAEDDRREVRLGLCSLVSSQFEARLGYRMRIGPKGDRANNLPWQRGLNTGFGVSFGRFWIDYSYEDASPLDNIHRFGVRARIGEPGSE